MSWLKALFSLCPHYPIQSEKLRKRVSQSIFGRCWMKQKAVIIPITITITIIMVMMAMTTTMIVMLMLMVRVTWMLTGLVMHGEVDAFPSLQLGAVIVPELDMLDLGHGIFLIMPLILGIAYVLLCKKPLPKELEIL